MISLLEAIILIAIVYAIGALTRHKMKNAVYIFLFFVFWLSAFLFGPTLQASVIDSKIEIKQVQFYLSTIQGRLSKEDQKFYQDKIRFHKSNGDRCFNDVKNKCSWLPSIDDRDTAKFCLITAGTVVAPADPLSKLIAVTVELFVYYGLNVIDEWNYIKNKMYWAQYHYEMLEFYQDVIRQES